MVEPISTIKAGTAMAVPTGRVVRRVLRDRKVLYRVPGHSVPADRQRLLDLVARDTIGSGQGNFAGRMAVPNYPWRPADIPLWPRERESGWRQNTGELRVVGGLTLPNRIMDRPWLDSRTKEIAAEVLRLSPVMGSRPFIDVSESPWSMGGWDVDEARATTVRLSAGQGFNRAIALVDRAYLNLSGRSLSLLVAIRWPRVGDRPSPLPLEVFYWTLLASRQRLLDLQTGRECHGCRRAKRHTAVRSLANLGHETGHRCG